jgi:hypothetical protein
MERVTVKIKDCDGEGYDDLFFNAPLGMNEKQAVQAVNKSIRKVHKRTDFTYDDLEAELMNYGFVQTHFVVADERW